MAVALAVPLVAGWTLGLCFALQFCTRCPLTFACVFPPPFVRVIRGAPLNRSEHRVEIENLSRRLSWQDLKDELRYWGITRVCGFPPIPIIGA